MFGRVNPSRLFSLVSVLYTGVFTASAVTNYVSTAGNDTNPGSFASPWRTIQKAANTLAPGDTAFVRGGIYNEVITVNVSGNPTGGYITFQNFPGETAVVDGTGLIVPPSNYAFGLFQLTDRSYVAIEGFEIRHFQTNSTSLVPAGIGITGASHDITVISNRVHDIANTNANGNAYGIEIHGTSTNQAITNLIIRGNELFNLKTGWSESMVLNGNVANFDVSGNVIHNNWNIGIDFIGYEGTCPNTNLDRARNGVCRSNIVWNCSTFSNPAYAEYSCAGIYVDGGSNVLIELNQIHYCDIGVEMESEHKGHAASACVCRDNLIWSNYMGGIFIGGYSSGVGRTENCIITHNTLYHDDTLGWGQGEMLFQYDTRSNVFTHNILVEADTNNNLLIGNTYTQNTNNLVDWNLYFAPGSSNTAKWQWKKTTYTGFSAYKTASHNDSNSIFADPLFLNATNLNFHLATNSPAFNAGDPNFQSLTNMPAETDIDLQPRVAFGRTDIGADELNIFSPTLGIAPPENGQVQLQLAGEPGHPFVWEQSSTFTNWLPFLTNYSDSAGFIELPNSMPVAMRFFRARMAQ